MSVPAPATEAMRTVRFHAYGEPAEVLQLDETAIPRPGPGRIRVHVSACGLNPADWALCRGLFPGNLPRGIGLDVSGVVDAVGDGVTGISVGDRAFGAPDYVGYASAGAADYAILEHWAPVPAGLDLVEAAALPMAIETAYRYLAWLDVKIGETLLVNGAGTVIGFAAVQMGLMRGARVIATAGDTFAERLRSLGATVTPYGEGVVERFREISSSPPDKIFDTAPTNLRPGIAGPGGVLPDLIKIAGGDPTRIMSCGDFSAAELGVRTGHGEAPTGENGAVLRFDKLTEFAELAANGRFGVPIARTFALEAWREALELSLGGRSHGKLVLLPSAAAPSR